MDDGGSPGRLLIIGGAEDRCCGAGLLERFAELCGGEQARIVLVTTATGQPDQVRADYEQVFRKLGVHRVTELRMHGRADADGEQAATTLAAATGVFFSGGDQSRLRTLVGSRSADVLRQRLACGLVVAGTSAGATALGQVMILGGKGADVSAAAVRTGPGLGLRPQVAHRHALRRARPAAAAAQRGRARPRSPGRRHRREHRDPGRRQPTAACSRCSAPAW